MCSTASSILIVWTLADRICQTMLHVGLDVIRHEAAADRVAALLCRILLHGLASRPPDDAELEQVKKLAALQPHSPEPALLLKRAARYCAAPSPVPGAAPAAPGRGLPPSQQP